MTVTIEGMDKLQRKLRRMASGQAARRAVAEAATYVKGQAAIYPPVRRQLQPFKTDKQRRYFFWALRSGAINVPYKRRGAGGGLAGGWTVIFTGDGLNAVVGNAVSYGPYVMGSHSQALYHAGNWKTEQIIASEVERPVLDIVTRHIRADIEGSA